MSTARFPRADRMASVQKIGLPDDELEAIVNETLRKIPAIRYTALPQIEVQARDGVVRLSGPVTSEVHRHEVVRAVAATPGVVRVEDDLVSDEQLVSAVALAMLPYREFQPSRVAISANLGTVVLEGELDSSRDVELALAVAGRVRGVRRVENRLRVRPVEAAPPSAAHHGAAPRSRLTILVPAETCPPWRYVGTLDEVLRDTYDRSVD
jgi:osmotically-inducible protein OsmY